jgi:hypothetical protein
VSENLKELERSRPGKVGKTTPAEYFSERSGIDARAAPGSSQLIQNNNQISTPVFVALIVALFIAATVSAIALVTAWEARQAAVIAEREARLSQRRYDDMRIYLEINGIHLPES